MSESRWHKGRLLSSYIFYNERTSFSFHTLLV